MDEHIRAYRCWSTIFDWDFAHLYNDWYMALTSIGFNPCATTHP